MVTYRETPEEGDNNDVESFNSRSLICMTPTERTFFLDKEIYKDNAKNVIYVLRRLPE